MTVHFQKALGEVKKRILSLSAFVEDSVRESVESVVHRDPAQALRVIDNDNFIDHEEVAIEEECLKILALYQPVAIDLRFIVAVLKINNDLERIGDLTVNIAESTSFLIKHRPASVPFDFSIMAGKAQTMLRNSLDSLVEMNTTLAREVCLADDEVDNLNAEVYRIVTECVMEAPGSAACLFHILSIARQLERIADLATNIAEDVIYMVDGEIVRHMPESYT